MIEEEKSAGENADREAPQAEEIGAEEMAELKMALAEAEAKAEANLAGWQRAQADFANYKRRCEQEKEDSKKFANAELIFGLLPVLDDFERAVGAIPPHAGKEKWVEGFRLIERKYRSSLELQGVTPIKAVGEAFDPRLHEAIKQDRGKDGIVIQELQKGYMLSDRVLRPSKVIVGNGEEDPENIPKQDDKGEENGPCQRQ
ncbi:MAG: nucleotide exchange factor GrpE [Dehalococcoidales bacterium]|nr:nucleotide exchange factor GrpE [Dehalococcoidales bacterium]